MRARRWLAILGSGLVACTADPYACERDDQCVRVQDRGTCAAPGFCAYPDDDCASGARFSPNAGDLAGRCVDEPGESSSSGDGDGSTTTGDPVPEGCGNGELDPDETCDDGNRVDGDGCSSACVPAGATRWVVRIDSPAGDDEAVGLVPGLDGGVVVAAELGDGAGLRSPHLRALAADGSMMAEWTDEPSSRRAHGVGARQDAVALAGDDPLAGASGTRAWAVILEADLSAPLPFVVDTLGEDTGRGIVATDRGFALVGTQDGLTAARFVETGGPDWRGPAVDEVMAVGARPDGGFAVAGTTGGATRWWVVSTQGVLAAEGTSDVDDVRAVGFDGLGRPVLGGVRQGQPRASAYALDGTLAWEIDGMSPGSGTVEAVASAPGGDVMLGGNLGSEAGWLMRLSIEPATRWVAEVLDDEQGFQLQAVLHLEDSLYVAGTAPGDGGDLDVVVASLQP